MAGNNVVTVSMVWLGIVLAISQGWVKNVRDWVYSHTHGAPAS